MAVNIDNCLPNNTSQIYGYIKVKLSNYISQLNQKRRGLNAKPIQTNTTRHTNTAGDSALLSTHVEDRRFICYTWTSRTQMELGVLCMSEADA